MIDAKPLEDSVAVRHQLAPGEIESAAREGFRSVINNRPDNEEVGQPTSAEMEAAARAAGLEYRHIPMVPGQLTDALVKDFASALAELPAPVLAFCKTGTRAAMLWGGARAKVLGVDGILEAADHAGYDLSQVRARLGELGQ